LKIQGKEFCQGCSPHPISRAEAEQSFQYIKGCIVDVPDELQKKLSDPTVVVLSIGINPLSGLEECD
jgi:hypothetical protein